MYSCQVYHVLLYNMTILLLKAVVMSTTTTHSPQFQYIQVARTPDIYTESPEMHT